MIGHLGQLLQRQVALIVRHFQRALVTKTREPFPKTKWKLMTCMGVVSVRRSRRLKVRKEPLSSFCAY
jgi:hypothetical protein